MARLTSDRTLQRRLRAPRAPAGVPSNAVIALLLVAVMGVPLTLAGQQQVPPAGAADGQGQDPEDPAAIQFALERICQLSLTDGHLMFTSRVALGSGRGGGYRQMDVRVPELSGKSVLTTQRGSFELENTRTVRDGSTVTLTIKRASGSVRIQRRVVRGASEHEVTLDQSYLDDSTGGGGRFGSMPHPQPQQPGLVSLEVTVNGRTIDSGRAEDFAALRREKSKPFHKYLVPALRELHAESLLQVDPWAARQALAEPVAAKDLKGKVDELVARLKDPSANVREKTCLQLGSLGPAAIVLLKRIDLETLSPEQSMTVQALINKHRPVSPAETQRLRDDVDFLVDCLYSEESDVPPLALARLRLLTGKDLHGPNLATRPESRGDAIEALRAELDGILIKKLPTPATTTRPARGSP